jgi:hypothetical protein
LVFSEDFKPSLPHDISGFLLLFQEHAFAGLYALFFMKLLFKIVATDRFSIFGVCLSFAIIALLFQTAYPEVLDDSVAKDNFVHVEILELVDTKGVLELYFGKNGGFGGVVEIFGYPLSEYVECLSEELSEVPDGFDLIFFVVGLDREGVVDFIDHGGEEVFDNILVDV